MTESFLLLLFLFVLLANITTSLPCSYSHSHMFSFSFIAFAISLSELATDVATLMFTAGFSPTLLSSPLFFSKLHLFQLVSSSLLLPYFCTKLDIIDIKVLCIGPYRCTFSTSPYQQKVPTVPVGYIYIYNVNIHV